MEEQGYVKVLKFDVFTQFCFAKELLDLVDIQRVFDEQDYESYNHKKMSKGYFTTDDEMRTITVKNLSEEDVQSFTGLADVLTLLRDYDVTFSDSYGKDDIIKKWNKKEDDAEVKDLI
jgi:hypothetical protein